MTSEAQKNARRRNHLIMRLRGAHRLFVEIGNTRGQTLIDKELKKLGAETERARRMRWRREYACLPRG